MTEHDFRRLALAIPGAIESSHFGHADFRTGPPHRIFATLSALDKGCGVLMLTPDQQAGMVADAPDVFSPVPGGWGRSGSTLVRLASVTEDVLAAALRLAWSNKAHADRPGSRRAKKAPNPRQ